MKVRVLVRARPLLRHEEGSSAHRSAVRVVHGVASRHGVASHAVDAVCGVGAPPGVFEAGRVDELVRAVLDGFRSTIFAYGQAGSGATFTMEGSDYSAKGGRAPTSDFERTPPQELGVTPRAADGCSSMCVRRPSGTPRARRRSTAPSLRVMCSFVQLRTSSSSILGCRAFRSVLSSTRRRWSWKGHQTFPTRGSRNSPHA